MKGANFRLLPSSLHVSRRYGKLVSIAGVRIFWLNSCRYYQDENDLNKARIAFFMFPTIQWSGATIFTANCERIIRWKRQFLLGFRKRMPVFMELDPWWALRTNVRLFHLFSFDFVVLWIKSEIFRIKNSIFSKCGVTPDGSTTSSGHRMGVDRLPITRKKWCWSFVLSKH